MAEKTRRKLQLTVVSQEQQLLTETVDSVTLPTVQGEITVLPGHIPLFSPLQTGVVTFKAEGGATELVISKGFVDVGVNNDVTVIVDVATHARDISLDAAEAAVTAAHETMENSRDQQELLMAEASLRLALLEVKVARSSKKSPIWYTKYRE